MNELSGITVLDLTRLLPGAVATQFLADHGAGVIKIEQPGTGDYARALNPGMFSRTNRGKQSVVVDLKNPDGRGVLLALAMRADVLIEGFRPGVMARLGLGYEHLHERNRRLIYASLSGYGQTGDEAALAGHDINYIAMGGLLGLNLPVIPGVQLADLVGGAMQAVTAILLALLDRRSGQYIDVSMTAGVSALLTIPFAAYADTGREPEPGNEMLSGRFACYNVYRAGDDRWLAVGALEQKFWAALCGRLGRDHWIPLQFREECQDELKNDLSNIFKMKPASAWFAELRQADCCVTIVRTVGEVAAEIHDGNSGGDVPGLGEHTEAVLARSGFTAGAIEKLKAGGAIA